MQKMKMKLQKRRRSRTGRNSRWLLRPRRLIWIRVHSLLLLLIAIVMIGSFFEVIYVRLPFLLIFSELVLPETSYPTCIFSSCLLSPFFLCRPSKKENIFNLEELDEGE